MSEKKIEKCEIQEIAEMIFKEIFTEGKRSGTEHVHGVEAAPAIGRRSHGFGEDNEARRSATHDGVFFSEGTDRGEIEALIEEMPFSPRLQRRDVMALRIERKSRREAASRGGAEEANRFSFAESATGLDDRLPERLSEAFCRDARRYDGAFERY